MVMEQISLKEKIEKFNPQNWAGSEVIDIIISCLNDDEPYEYNKRVRGSTEIVADLFLPNGCKALGFDAKSIIEVKRYINNDTLRSIRFIYDNMIDNNVICRMIVICGETTQTAQFYKVGYLESRNIETIEIDELIIKIRRIKNKIKVKSISDDDKQNKRIEDAKAAVRKNKQIVFFLGAGVSRASGILLWEDLLKRLAEKLWVDKSESFINKNELTSIQKGRYIKAGFEDKDIEFVQSVKEIIYEDNPVPKELIKVIGNYALALKLDSIITYNYDNLVEEYINGLRIGFCYSIYGDSQIPGGDMLPVYHVHGYIPKSDKELASNDIVFGEEEYHRIYQQPYNWSNIEQIRALTRKTCFFIGLSMNDPNLRRIIDIANKKADSPRHFVFLKKENEEFDKMDDDIFEKMGLWCIRYNDHDELPGLLSSLL